MALPININELINGRTVEWERIEFKKGWNPLKTLHSVCAFANDFNNWGGGYIIIGVQERRAKPVFPPVGLSPREIDSVQKELLRFCHKLRPQYFPVVEPVDVKGRTILVIWCPGGAGRPYKAPERLAKKANYSYYIRRYSSTKKASEPEERQLLSMANQIPFDDRINHHAQMPDLNLTLIQSYLGEIKSGLLEESTRMPFAELCRRMNIVEGPDEYLKPKNAGLLFFNDSPYKFFSGACIDVIEFSDEAGDSFRERTFRGPLHQQVRDALTYLKNDVIFESVRKISGKAEAERFFNYPYAAIEEALVNAVYHRSYQDMSPVEIRVFPNRIEVVSYPGPLPPLNKDNLMKLGAVARKYRNRRIGDFLKELHLTEGRGTGFPKIRRALKNNGSPVPIFKTDEERSYFATILRINPKARISEQVAGVQPESQPESQPELLIDRVLHILSAGDFSKSEIAQKLNQKSISGQLNKVIRDLLKKGSIEYTIPDKPKSRLQKYKITESCKALLSRRKNGL